MKILNSPILAILCLIGFIWLAYHSLHRAPVYAHSVFSVLDIPITLKQRQVDVLMSLWHITEAELRQPITIFGKE